MEGVVTGNRGFDMDVAMLHKYIYAEQFFLNEKKYSFHMIMLENLHSARFSFFKVHPKKLTVTFQHKE